MKDKLNQFISNLNGEFVEVSSYKLAAFQCMDAAYAFVFCLGYPKSTIQNSAAYLVWTNASDTTRRYFDLIENKLETIPQAGDLFVIGKSSSYPYGHIGIVIEATQTKMKCFEQNFPTGTNAHIQDRGYSGVVGFLRPKVTNESAIPAWLQTLLQEGGMTINDESKIRAYFEKAKRYDEDTRVLQEQVKTANEQLAEKSLDVSNLTDKVQKLIAKVDELTELYNKAVVERSDFFSQLNVATTRLDTTLSELEALKIDYSKLRDELTDGLTAGELIKLVIKKIFGK